MSGSVYAGHHEAVACPSQSLWRAQMLFFSAERLLGTERAMLLAGLALLPGLDWPVIQFLDLWRSSLAVGQELLSGALAVIIV